MGSKGTQEVKTQSAPPPEVMAAYRDVMARAQGVASTPYQEYGGPRLAGFTGDQTAAFNTIAQSQGISMPYINQAADYARQGAAPISGSAISNYLNPYTSSVIDATMANIAESEGQQQNQVIGNAIAQGALGGDRVGLTQAELARQQALARNQTFAQLNAGNYSQALAAAQADAGRAGQAAYSFGNLGQQAQASTLTGAQAQLASGALQQQQAQSGLNIPYQDFLRRQAFPYQQTGWLAGIATGLGSNMGGTSSTESPAPNPWNQVLGVGLQLAGAYMNRGGAIKGYAEGGAPAGISMPYADAQSFIPVIPITPGSGPPKPPSPAGDGQSGANKMMSDAGNLADKMKGAIKSPGDPLDITPPGASFTPDAIGSVSPFGTMPAMSPLGPIYARGGSVKGYADGGFPTFADRFMGDSIEGGISLPMTDFADRFPEAGTFVASNGLADNRPMLVSHGIASPYNPGEMTPVPRPRPVDAPGVMVADDGERYPRIFDDMSQPDLPGSVMALRNDRRPPRSPAADLDDPNSSYNQGLLMPSPVGAPSSDGPGIGIPYQPDAIRTARPEASAAQQRSGFNLGILPDNLRMPLIAAGLGMMASHSPYLGVAFGEGGLRGLQTYQEARKQEVEQATKERQFGLQEQRVENEAQRLSQQADHAARQLELQTKTQADMADYRRQMLERENSQYIGPTADGTGSVFLNRNTGQTEVRAVQIGSKTSSPGAVLDDETASSMAAQYLNGDRSVLTNLGRGAQGAENVIKVRREILNQAKNAGMTPADIASTMAEYQGQVAGQRSTGVRAAQISLAANEAKNMTIIALKASEAVPRTQFVPINQAIQAVQRGSSDPKLARFVAATNSLVNTYARAVSPTGVPTDAQRAHAYEMLNAAQSPEAYAAVVDIMQEEMDAAIKAPTQVQEELRAATKEKGKRISGAPTAPEGVPAGTPAAGEKPRVSTKAEYEALAPGTEFIGSNGKPYTKPRQ